MNIDNISTSEEHGRLNGEGKVINIGVGKTQIQAVAKGKDYFKVENEGDNGKQRVDMNI